MLLSELQRNSKFHFPCFPESCLAARPPVKSKIFQPLCPSFEFTQTHIAILQGMTVMLGCDVDANPVINATGWLKNEKQFDMEHPVLVLHDVDIKGIHLLLLFTLGLIM